ncbi:hypothetical protein [Reichenbachiella ulvae]|uniref:Uncharacterized protein n=1 Tax=Reichenbachiella ulvae TaxID=2980104 RepID=A0ABT3CUI0_9BACT|nr:hypothetical protein [Reichenbachiella ulvae]MCV9387247.1 hypothetical protein [Reichenbachiella ulvae]
MHKRIIRTLIFIGILFVVSFYSKSQSRKVIFFHEIDDQARVYVDDELIYESDVVGYLGGVSIKVDITKHITTGDETVTIKLINIQCSDCSGGNPWSIIYELLDDEESIDYQVSDGIGGAGSKPVYSYSFRWDDL